MDHTDVDAVLFDLDGVVTPTAEKHRQAWRRVFAEFFDSRGARAYEESDYFDFLDGKPRDEGVRSILDSRGLSLEEGSDDDPDADTVHGLGARKNAVFLELLDEGIEAYPGTVRYLDALDAAGIAKAIVSSSKNARQVLRSAGLAERFGVVVDGAVAAEEGLPGKPEPDTFLRGAELVDVPPERCVVIEDAVSGVMAGASGGFHHVVGVDRGAGEPALAEAGADTVVKDLDELVAGAEAVRR